MSTLPKKQVSMSRHMALALAFAMTLIIGPIAVGFYLYTSTELERNFTRKVDETLSYLDGTLAQLLWSVDHDTVTRVAETMLRDDLVVGVTVLDEKGGSIFSDQEQGGEEILLRTHSIRFQDRIVGEMTLIFSRASLAKTLSDILWISLSVWLLAVLSIGVLSSIFIRKFFRGPLMSFIDLAESYRQNPELPPLTATPFLEFQPIEEVVKNLANDVFHKLRELDDHRKHLETEVAERKEIERLLLKSKNEAENANQAKSKFLASMSHELRTPLNAVLGFAQILQSDSTNPLTEKQIKHIEYILEGGNHLLELVNQVLDLARVEADQLELSFEDVDVGQIVADCVALTIPLGKPRAITVTNELASGQMPHLRADKLRLKQVLINLLSNAVKYNNEGGTVTITGREVDRGFLRIFVTDTGIGIAENDRTRIFQMFDRLDIPHTLATEGAGIGLSVTKLLVEKMAGQIGFESEKGIGSTFWIELPLASNDDVLIWTDALKIGVDALDKDHQVVISILNRLMRRSADDADVDDTIDELIAYTQYHFRREEAIMEVCGYSGFERHCDLHRRLNDDMNQYSEAWRNERNQGNLALLQKFFKELLLIDLLEEDKKIANSAKGKDRDIRQKLEALGLTR